MKKTMLRLGVLCALLTFTLTNARADIADDLKYYHHEGDYTDVNLSGDFSSLCDGLVPKNSVCTNTETSITTDYYATDAYAEYKLVPEILVGMDPQFEDYSPHQYKIIKYKIDKTSYPPVVETMEPIFVDADVFDVQHFGYNDSDIEENTYYAVKIIPVNSDGQVDATAINPPNSVDHKHFFWSSFVSISDESSPAAFDLEIKYIAANKARMSFKSSGYGFYDLFEVLKIELNADGTANLDNVEAFTLQTSGSHYDSHVFDIADSSKNYIFRLTPLEEHPSNNTTGLPVVAYQNFVSLDALSTPVTELPGLGLDDLDYLLTQNHNPVAGIFGEHNKIDDYLFNGFVSDYVVELSSTSIDDDADIVSYEWEVVSGEGSIAANEFQPEIAVYTPSASENNASIDNPKKFTFKLTVTDSTGASSFIVKSIYAPFDYVPSDDELRLPELVVHEFYGEFTDQQFSPFTAVDINDIGKAVKTITLHKGYASVLNPEFIIDQTSEEVTPDNINGLAFLTIVDNEIPFGAYISYGISVCDEFHSCLHSDFHLITTPFKVQYETNASSEAIELKVKNSPFGFPLIKVTTWVVDTALSVLDDVRETYVPVESIGGLLDPVKTHTDSDIEAGHDYYFDVRPCLDEATCVGTYSPVKAEF